ncbi:MAG TPA: hypothetical protein VFL91_08540 [Thermomicrobiales bacterium]|nr:hypothetical protein [Thermomicrobiales bacterium]
MSVTFDQAMMAGLESARPAATAGTVGRHYAATDTGNVWRDNGSGWDLVANVLQLGTTATTAAAGNDSRLSDARTPTAHATTHHTGGSDPLAAADVGAAAVSHHTAHESGGGDAFTGIVPGEAFAPTGLTGATAASRYVGATASGAPTTGTFNKGDFVLDQSGSAWVCTTAGSPGTWTQLAGGGGGSGPAGHLGYAQITAAQTTTSVSTLVDITGLSVTVTIGSRPVRIIFYSPLVDNGGTARIIVALYDVTAAAQIQEGFITPSSGNGHALYVSSYQTPAAGSRTYKAQFRVPDGGTGRVFADAADPSYIYVEEV